MARSFICRSLGTLVRSYIEPFVVCGDDDSGGDGGSDDDGDNVHLHVSGSQRVFRGIVFEQYCFKRGHEPQRLSTICSIANQIQWGHSRFAPLVMTDGDSNIENVV